MAKTKQRNKEVNNNDRYIYEYVQQDKKKKRKVRRNQNTLAGLTLPISRVRNIVKSGNFSKRVSLKSAIHLTAALQYLTSEILDISALWTMKNKKNRMTPRHLMMAVREDADFSVLLHDTVISGGGVVPHIEKTLLPKHLLKKVDDEDAGPSQEY